MYAYMKKMMSFKESVTQPFATKVQLKVKLRGAGVKLWCLSCFAPLLS